MTIDFYYLLASAPCRSVLMVAKSLGITLNLKEIDLSKGEHLTPEFIKINPQHTIPTLVDNGFVLTESRAIAAYLVEQYGKDDSLYPKDAKKKAVVNQRLYFDMGVLYQRFADYYYPKFQNLPVDESKKEKVDEAFVLLDKFLEQSKYAAGDNLTIADYSIVATLATIEGITNYDISSLPNLSKWYKNVKTQLAGYEEINQKGVELMKQYIAALLEKK
uniref:Uncharacterized protein n=1 Tax=Clastoptera arizonana TaxID=38151 RepID=A0A1B6CSS0_9HEMI